MDQNCEICEHRLSVCWRDQHGIAACVTCGAPYRIYHYDADHKRIDKKPELLLQSKWVPLMRRYWSEEHRNVAPGAYMFVTPSREIADTECLSNWLERNEDK
jgi:hypothetical protein